ncbi:MAG: NAD(P)-dependent oxidoreductase, partial [Cyclobacteriaceae bacterium]
NVGRGDSVDEIDLLRSVELGHLRRAVLDVFTSEPLPEKSPLWANPKVTISPHQSGLTTINDVAHCFRFAYEAINEGTTNDLFINRKRGY